MLDRSLLARSDALALPSCLEHSGSLVRRYRSHGPSGPGVYPQCVPADGAQPHLLAWLAAPATPHPEANFASGAQTSSRSALTVSERDVLVDAAAGLSVRESAARRQKGTETVKTQRRNLMLKLGARNMTQAVAMTIGDGHLASRKAA
jgi:DNA-binding CsgD family transcriptional regulator